ncbi:putative integron gene cassette protein [Candidatus Moduliflexus flocculans]|uniref:Putative integron gene cassette protein n=1 Tax=Candidatus Moduliflexus flocculans TaxID=1499966 RepID=A0A0S6VZL0_9BACT|nr:putative integron gene cassette protein [Candidatus Moduliflexus flocculans]
MNEKWMSWGCVAFAMIHVWEEYHFGWLAWAQTFVAGVTLAQFVWINALFIALCVLAAVGRSVTLKLSIASLILFNLCVHLFPTLYFGRYSPGLYSALLLYFPAGLWMYQRAWRSQSASRRQIALSWLLGAGWMMFPFLFQGIRLFYIRRR